MRWQEFGSRERENDGADEVYRKAVAVPQPAGDGKDTARGIFCGEGRPFRLQKRRTNCSEMAAPYPPGIPLICPGERYSREMLELMRQYKADGCEFHGPSDASLEVLYVLKEE